MFVKHCVRLCRTQISHSPKLWDIDECANVMEGLLWKQIPEAPHLRENVGTFTDEVNKNLKPFFGLSR